MITPEIIFEDNDILVINKPAGLVVNKSDSSHYQETIQEWAEGKIDLSQSSPDSEFADRGGIVHRLDKETSGILVIAKNEKSFTKLQEQWKSRDVKKTYITLVHGKVEPESGEIEVTMGRLPWNRTRFGVLAEGRESSSSYKALKHFKAPITDKRKGEGDFEDVTLLEFYPHTGRTHQIRVHAKHIGHPVYSDELYAGRKTARRDRKLLGRQFLHATSLKLKHPTTGEELNFESELPGDLQKMLNALSE